MSGPSSRVLRLLSLLQARRYWPGADLAERLGVSVRTLRRDVDRLRDLGYPIEAQRGIDGGYQLVGGAQLPPLAVDEEEAVALAIGLQAAAMGWVTGVEEAAVRALAKITQIMPSSLRRRVDGLTSTIVPSLRSRGSAVSVTVLTQASQACRDCEELAFDYTSRTGERTTRRVEPHTLVLTGYRWYLVCYDLMRNDWRSFRLDRMGSLRVSGSRFNPRPIPMGDAAAFVRAGIDSIPHQLVRVEIAAPASSVRERLGNWCSVEEVDEHSCRLEMRTESLDWAAWALGVVGADFRVVEPPALTAMLGEWSARFGASAP